MYRSSLRRFEPVVTSQRVAEQVGNWNQLSSIAPRLLAGMDLRDDAER